MAAARSRTVVEGSKLDGRNDKLLERRPPSAYKDVTYTASFRNRFTLYIVIRDQSCG